MKQVGKVKFTMNYRVIRTLRRTISLEITRDLRIVVRAPLHVSDSEIRRFVDEHQDWISVHLDKQKIRLENKIRLTEEQRYLLRVLAEDELPKKVRHFGGLMNLLPDRVGITGARTRLGSCGSNRHINFSMYLMLYPEPLIDYVVVHELAHLRYARQDKAFYGLIAQDMPDYRERWLQKRKLDVL